MNGKSTLRTGTGGLSPPHTSARRASGLPGSIAFVAAALLFTIAMACPRATDADESGCIAKIVELEPGRIRLRGADGTSKKIDSAELPERICVLAVVEKRPQYRVSIDDGEWEGVWLIKRRNVVRIEGLVNVECSRSTISAGVEIRSERAGGVRAIGEEPCN